MSGTGTTRQMHDAPVAGRARALTIALWVLQLFLALQFVMAGFAKVFGDPAMVEMFATIGIGQWFRYVTGLIEVSSAVALLVPSLAVFGAVALVTTMIGAVATHLFIIGGSPAMPTILLLGSAIVVWARRRQLLGDQHTAR